MASIENRRARGGFRRRRPMGERIELSITILEINGNRYVAGMHWQPLSQTRSPLKEAKEEGQKRGWDVVSIKRGSDWIQAGFVSRASGVYKGMYSIASSLAGVLGPHWCGVFAAPEPGQYLVVAVDQSGRIVAASDRVLPADSAKALSRRIQAENDIPYENTFAPLELEMAPSARELGELLPPSLPKAVRKQAELTYLTYGVSKESLRNLAIIGALITAALVAFHYWDAYEEGVKQEAARKQQEEQNRRLAIANENARRKLEAQALAHPWAVMPSADDFIHACGSVVDRLPLNMSGWNFSDATCEDKKGITITYLRGDGTSQQDLSKTIGQALMSISKDNQLPVVSFTNNGDNVTITFPLTGPVAGDDPLQPLVDAMSNFLGPLQRANTSDVQVFSNISIEQQEVVIKMPPAPAGQPPIPAPQPTWRMLHWSLDSQIPPRLVFGDLKDRNGLRVTSIDTKLQTEDAQLKWTMKGDFYVQR
ncbi:type 4b pilus protein PilO2 [Burkholderia anthina]|uniref:type 4b pilus protein PilO2 n=1 Tax=Burkholderia anthina TaxID=179879 RepID=UPI00158D5A9D